ncbi:hypothetical protein [Mesorhizobium sp.]|uniref:hypothetical protein n=1 Tax=Mesorhizobium sp. TaxID=1871066 RepID=UPI0025CB7CAC|nr:hypothetical protein [Mesorhizobium sp.]
MIGLFMPDHLTQVAAIDGLPASLAAIEMIELAWRLTAMTRAGDRRPEIRKLCQP